MQESLLPKKLLLEKIEVVQFKNYSKADFNFHPLLNAIVGKNGKGKTNLLDAIYMLSFTKSYFTKNDTLNVKFGEQGFKIAGRYTHFEKAENVEIILRENNKKELIYNQELIKKYSLFIGTFPTIMVSPDDIDLINGNGEIRRSFIDKFICQIDQEYLITLITFQKILQQKNALLKEWHLKKQLHLLEIYNQQLEPIVNIIYQKRCFFLQQLVNYTTEYYHFLADFSYAINLKYTSQLETKSWKQLVSEYTDKECFLQRTLIGIHKDDFVFKLHDCAFKEIASQGQKKSLLLALKIAEAKIIYETKNIYPMLLLDDIFEKLDEQRLDKLFHLILGFKSMQIFITDVNEQRIKNKISKLNPDFTTINI